MGAEQCGALSIAYLTQRERGRKIPLPTPQQRSLTLREPVPWKLLRVLQEHKAGAR